MPKKLHTPHDAFFKLVLSNIEIAKDFFRANLPKTVLDEVDLTTLAIYNGSFVDKELNQSHVDILYTVNFNGEQGYLFLHAEQQSTPEKWMAFRMTRYAFSIMQQHLQQGHDTLPLVYGVIVYTGKAPYPYSTDIFDLFAQKDLAKKILYQPFQLISVNECSKKTIQSQRLARIVLRLLGCKDAPEIIPTLVELEKAGLFQLAESMGLFDFLLGMVEYIVDQLETKQEANEVVDLLSHAIPSKRDKIMTIAERLKQQGHRAGLEKGLYRGRQEGRQEGIEEGKYEIEVSVVSHMAKMGLADEDIQKYTNISLDLIKEIKKHPLK